ncbi:MAG: NAD-glutamate dehydrogenase, partial [Acidimicrobiia bacterium]|nr:NAD-glutamate dehydrogenase [Acidimicrobiia bacterium]
MPTDGAAERIGRFDIDEIVASLPSDTPDVRRTLVQTFAVPYLRRMSDADLKELTPDALAAEILDLVAFVDERRGAACAVRVFTPTESANGYTAGGTVVEVVVDDMPFLVDSTALAVARSGAGIERHLHPLVGVVRDADGQLMAIEPARSVARTESIQHFELDRHLSAADQEVLQSEITRVLGDVRVAVADFEAMRVVVTEMIGSAKASVARYGYQEIEETVEFLEWLLDDNFVFLGYKIYDVSGPDDDLMIQARAESGLGILRANGKPQKAVPMADLPNYVQGRYFGGDLVVITKTNSHATVHRDARMDYIGLRQTNEQGRTEVEMRLIGLFTSKAYMATASEIPVLRRKLSQILERQDLLEGSHDYKTLVQLFESFPKDDLFAMPVEDLSRTLGALIDSEEFEHVRLFVRKDPLQRSVGILVTVPRDRFNADLRIQLQELFRAEFGAQTIDYRLSLGESGDARIHFTVWLASPAPMEVDVPSLETKVLALARTW